MEAKRLGDVAVFEAGDDLLGKCISILTNSNVSHAAMVYGDESMVEMGGYGIQSNKFVSDDNGEVVHFMRMKPEVSPAPLIQAADVYLNAGVKYDYPSLLILAGMLIYQRVRPTWRWAELTELILKIACLELDKLLNRLIHNPADTPVMMCSQLVYQCYLDCGEDYIIRLKDPLLKAPANGEISLYDLARESPVRDLPHPDSLTVQSVDEQEILEALHESLIAARKAPPGELIPKQALGDALPWVMKFLDLLEDILEKIDLDIPMPALFVTPADLYEHTENLQEYGSMKLRRVKSNIIMYKNEGRMKSS